MSPDDELFPYSRDVMDGVDDEWASLPSLSDSSPVFYKFDAAAKTVNGLTAEQWLRANPNSLNAVFPLDNSMALKLVAEYVEYPTMFAYHSVKRTLNGLTADEWVRRNPEDINRIFNMPHVKLVVRFLPNKRAGLDPNKLYRLGRKGKVLTIDGMTAGDLARLPDPPTKILLENEGLSHATLYNVKRNDGRIEHKIQVFPRNYLEILQWERMKALPVSRKF